MNLIDVVHCRTEEMAKELFDFFIQKGYSVSQSSVEIETGTHGKHVVKRLDILSKSEENKSSVGNYDFSQFGNIMSFNTKIMKYIQNNNCSRLKDYICSAFDTFDPSRATKHPCHDLIKEASDFIKKQGWKVTVGEWKQIGNQVIILSPNNECFHSKFNHGRDQ